MALADYPSLLSLGALAAQMLIRLHNTFSAINTLW
jgi:hypothetical protein